MRLSIAVSCIALSTQLPSAAASFITLSQFQPIAGFSITCSNAYNTPLTDCMPKDFEEGRICSMECVAMLRKVSAHINTACKGTKAYPNTLIGMFFTSAGVTTLCPHAEDSSGSGGSTSVAQSKQTTVAVHTSKDPPKQTTESTKAEASTTRETSQTRSSEAQTSSTASSTSLLKSTVSESSPRVRPTINSSSTLTQSGLAGLRSSAALASAQGAQTTSSAQPTATNRRESDHNGNSGSSGGTPFDISASTRTFTLSPALLIWTLGLTMLLRIV